MLIADLHIHSKYSRATSKDCVPEALDLWARRKGIGLVGTGDFTHPAWRAELADKLAPAEEGLYTLKGRAGGPRFVVTGEISTIYKKDGRTRKVHSLILLPSLEAAEALSLRLEAIGNIHSDGRPILGLDTRDLLEITLESCPEAVFIPAHIWTPHFSLFGAFSGFDTIQDCFGDLTPYIHALETGLSSDPPMNWRLSALDGYQLVSNSDAHSPSKLGREANLLDIQPSFPALSRALQTGDGLKGTIEFFPEEGKYHFDGHRPCHQCLTPEQAVAAGGKCPICGKKLTIGVLHRVEELADRPEGYEKPAAAAFESLVPLPEVIAAANGGSATGKKTLELYETMLQKLGAEFRILREVPPEDVERVAGPCVAEGIRRLRAGRVERDPGYDGVYGTIGLLTPAEREALNGQVSLFFGGAAPKQKRKRTGLDRPTPAPSAPQLLPVSAPLDPEQLAAVTAPESAVAVLAGPGSGKTRTLVQRIAWLVESEGVKPKDITAVTFTNKAAGELRARLEARLGKRTARAMTIGTFHAICQDLLGAAVAGRYETWELAADVLRETGAKADPAQLLRAVSREKNGFGAEEPEVPDEAVQHYIARLRAMGLSDFDDLLLDAQELDHTVPHLLVDEFQDVDPIQYRLILAWSRKGKTLYTIGDENQAIYGFRGAKPAVFADFSADVSALKTYRLDRNYRSTPEILAAAQAVLPAAGRLNPLRPSGPSVRLLTAEGQRAEAIFVAKEIARQVGGVDMLEAQGVGAHSFADIAVLCRTRRQLRLIEDCLAHDDIPCVVAGREDFLTDPQVRGVLCLCRLLLEPQDLAAQESCRKLLPMAPQAEVLADLAPQARTHRPDKLLDSILSALGLDRRESLDRLRHMAVLYPDLPAFLQALTIGQEADLLRSAGMDYASGAVTLMTFHAAKGLEFSVVFLCGLDKGTLPLESKRRVVDEAEERRLLYVGMTRARDELILLSGREPSPFLASLPEAVVRGEAAPRREKPQGVQLSFF